MPKAKDGPPLPGLGRRIAQARTAAGLSQEALAARIGLSRHSLARYETGKTRDPFVSYVKRIAEVCEVTTDWLVGLAPRPRLTGDDRSPSPSPNERRRTDAVGQHQSVVQETEEAHVCAGLRLGAAQRDGTGHLPARL